MPYVGLLGQGLPAHARRSAEVDALPNDRPDIEFISADPDESGSREIVAVGSTDKSRWLPPILLVILAGLIGWSIVSGRNDVATPDPDDRADEELPDTLTPLPPSGSERFDAVRFTQSIPRSLLAAELYFADPSEEGLRDLFDVVGGFEGLELATAEGAFDLVSFDANDENRLLASRRLSYGNAENQQVNEIWELGSDGVIEQALWAPGTSHDFAHFNADGSATMWVHGGGDGFAPRKAVVLTGGFVRTTTTEPIYASRFTTADDTVFALTGNGDYYTNDVGYVDLVADDGTGLTLLHDGSFYGWINNPAPDILVAYPIDGQGSTAVWDVATLRPLPTHQLAGRSYQRSAVSGDGAVAVGVTFGGELEVIDLGTGQSRGTFGEVDVDRVDRPIALNFDGTVAVTIENTGRVSIWWVGADKPISSIITGEGQPRWVSAAYAPTSTSVVSWDTRRIALSSPASGQTASTWIIADTDTNSWIQRACEQAGRSLTDTEIEALGLPGEKRVCTS